MVSSVLKCMYMCMCTRTQEEESFCTQMCIYGSICKATDSVQLVTVKKVHVLCAVSLGKTIFNKPVEAIVVSIM